MIKRIMPHELNEDEIMFYHRAIETDEHSGDIDMVSEAIYRAYLQLWLWVDDEDDSKKMVIITEVKTFPDGYRQLLIAMLSGTGGSGGWTECVETFSEIVCHALDCQDVVAYIRPEIWEIFKSRVKSELVNEEYIVVSVKSKYVRGDVVQ